MIRKFVLAGAAFAVAASVAGSAVAGPNDYAFEPVKAEVKSGNEATVAVRLVHKPSGKPVADAAITQTRLDMAPDGMASMTTAHVPLPSPEPGVYAFKASLLGAPMEYRLADDALEWRKGAYAGRAAYGRIRRMRLSFRPMTMQNYRFLTEVWPDGGPKLQIASTSWKSLVEHERFDAAYRAFVIELCRRVGAAGGDTSFETGTPALIYWPGLAVFVGASLGLAGLLVRALMIEAWSGAAFVGGFLALFLWQAGTLFRRNRPGSFRGDAVPPQVLPRG